MKNYREQYLDEMDRMIAELREMKADFDRMIEANNQILRSAPIPERFACELGIAHK